MATLGFLLLLWTPYTLVTNMVDMNDPANPEWLSSYGIAFAYSTMLCNSWVNPVLYCWLNKDYRKAYMRVLGGCGGRRSATVHASQMAGSSGDNAISYIVGNVTLKNT